MRAPFVVIDLEGIELALEIPSVPEGNVIQKLAPDGPDQPLDERM